MLPYILAIALIAVATFCIIRSTRRRSPARSGQPDSTQGGGGGLRPEGSEFPAPANQLP